jgi:membrane-bound ClpP family serine protease
MAAPSKRPGPLKPAGFLLLIVGWILVLAAVQMLKTGSAQGAFVAAGIAVEILGFVLVVRSHLAPKPERNQ